MGECDTFQDSEKNSKHVDLADLTVLKDYWVTVGWFCSATVDDPAQKFTGVRNSTNDSKDKKVVVPSSQSFLTQFVTVSVQVSRPAQEGKIICDICDQKFAHRQDSTYGNASQEHSTVHRQVLG